MIFNQTNSGILAPQAAAEPPPKPPEHPVRAVIREHLAKLADELGRFEQTTHGRIPLPPGGFGSVARELRQCYESPRAFTISSLSQEIRAFVKEAAEAA